MEKAAQLMSLILAFTTLKLSFDIVTKADLKEHSLEMLSVFLADLACDSVDRNEERLSHGNSQLSTHYHRLPQLREKEAFPLLTGILPPGDMSVI